jgi:hypothetical protein
MIDYNQPWQVLDIDISNAIRSDFDFDNLLRQSEFATNPGALWNFTDDKLAELFNLQWLNYFSSMGFAIRNVLLFYRSPYFLDPNAHIDYVGNENPIPGIYALNFVASPNDDSEMIWYDLTNREGHKATDANYANPQNHYEYWPAEQLVGCETNRKCIGNQLTLVSTGKIHSIIMGKRPRWAVSIRLVRNDQIGTWRDAVNLFSPYFKKEITQ